MRPVVLFLVLAVAGLGALVVVGGGVHGPNATITAPVVPEVASAARGAEGEPVALSDLPLGSQGSGVGRAGSMFVEPMRSFDRTFDRPAVWVDPATHERVDLPNAPYAWVTFREPAPMRDATGAPGMRWLGVRIVLYRDPKTYVRAEVDALRANTKLGRRGLERLEITSEEGFETTTLRAAPSEKTPQERTSVRLTKDVRITDVVQRITIRTSDVVVDREAGTAEGPAPITVEAPGYVITGIGFRLDTAAERIEILRATELDARELVDARSAATSSGEEEIRPRRVLAKGSTLVTNHKGDGEPWTDVRMDGGVHIELDGGGRLDASSVLLRLVDRPSAGDGREDPRKDDANGLGGRRPRLRRMVADGDVRYEGKDEEGALLAATGSRLVLERPLVGVRSTLLVGRSLVTWRGELSLPGDDESLERILRASATESILFGPSDASPDAAVIDLVGAARVECGRAPSDPDPQRIAADRMTLQLRLRAVAKRPQPVVPHEPGRRKPQGSRWKVTSFSATGGVTIDGPRLSGGAREMRGFELDLPTSRISATGPDAHLAIAEDVASGTGRASSAKAGSSAGPKRSTPAGPEATWVLERLTAREDARGSFGVGEGTATFAGDSLTLHRASGAEVRRGGGEDARVTLEGREGRDRSIDAPTIVFRTDGAERTLETQGRTHAVVWLGDEGGPRPQRAAAPREARVVELRSGARIDLTSRRTFRADGSSVLDGLTVSLVEGASLSARSGGRVTDRLTAGSIDLALVHAIPSTTDMSFAMDAPKPASRADGAPGAGRPHAGTGAPKAPGPPARFVLECDRLALVIDASGSTSGGLRRVTAEGRVEAKGDDPKDGARRFEGERFAYDAASGVGVLTSSAKRGARVDLGDEPAIQRVLSPRIEVLFKDGVLARATFSPPVAGLVHTPAVEGGKPTGELERYVLADDSGSVTMEGSTIRIVGTEKRPVRVSRVLRDASGKDVGDPLLIVTPSLRLTTTTPFGTTGSSLARLEADGAGTYILSGADERTGARILGDTIRFERPATAPAAGARAGGVLRVTSTKGVVLVSKPSQAILEAYEVTVDLGTGMMLWRLKSANLVSPR